MMYAALSLPLTGQFTRDRLEYTKVVLGLIVAPLYHARDPLPVGQLEPSELSEVEVTTWENVFHLP